MKVSKEEILHIADLANLNLEEGCTPKWICEEELKAKLPLPYHKKGIEYYFEFYNKK